MPTKRKFEEKKLLLLHLCNQPRTLHCIKDIIQLNNDSLKFYIKSLVKEGLLIVKLKEHDDRGTKQISTTDDGKKLLRSKGIYY